MLTESDLNQVRQKLNLSNTAWEVIEKIRSLPPARRVQSAAGNVSVRYPSRKMGRIIQAESHRNELAGVYEKEYDPDVLEYYDQPFRIKLTYESKNGRRVGVCHTPDYFVIKNNSIGWEEWKTESELKRLADQMPHRYTQEGNSWHCPPGEEYAAQYEFFYQVRSSSEIDWILQRNLLFLEDYLHEDKEVLDSQSKDAVNETIAKQPGITLHDLLGKNLSAEVIYSAIAKGEVYVDLCANPLAEPETVLIFQSQEVSKGYGTAAANCLYDRDSLCVDIELGSTLDWDGKLWTLVNLGQIQVALLAADGGLNHLPLKIFEELIKTGELKTRPKSVEGMERSRIQALLLEAGPLDFAEANRRYAIITPRLSGHKSEKNGAPPRTIRRWICRWKKAEELYGCGYLGLLPRYHDRGNCRPKLLQSTIDMMNEFIINDYETLKQKSKASVYGVFLQKCEERSICAPSYITFIEAIRKRPRLEQIKKRQGKRVAYQHESFYQELTMTTPRHGDRPFEIGHIDHTLLDIELVCSQTGRNLGRPWGTFLSDAYSRRLLAVTLSFDSPSYRSCMMALRECVQRHGRLPQILVVDGGREFESVYFETLLARYECSKKTRPGAQPRFGSICERLFGTTNTRFIYNLLGNTQITKNVRQVTKSISPQEQACWTFGQFHARLREWAYEIYDTLEHPALGQTPREAFDAGLIQSGQRAQRFIRYDENFRMLTLPTTPKGTAKVLPRLGVKINHLCYWSDAFLNPEVEMRQVPIRYDPFNAGVAYAFVQKHWVECISELYAVFAGRSEREIQLTTAELKKRKQLHGQRFSITARKLADFLTSLEAEEVLLEQRLRDFEAKEVLSAKKQQVSSKKTEASIETDVANSEDISTLEIYEDF
jgi:transposase InsO family protein